MRSAPNALFLLLLIAMLGAGGLFQASSAADSDARVPVVRDQDAFQYSVVRLAGADRPTERILTFRFDGVEEIQAPWGETVQLGRILALEPSPQGFVVGRTLYVDEWGTIHAIAHSASASVRDQGFWVGGPARPWSATSESVVPVARDLLITHDVEHMRLPFACWLQAQAWDAPLPAQCDWAAATDWGRAQESEAAQVHVERRADSPYPSLIRYGSGPGGFEARLLGLDAHGARLETGSPSGGATIRGAPRSADGPDASGFSHTFSLQEALRDARGSVLPFAEQEVHPGECLRSFERSEAGGYLAQAQYYVVYEGEKGSHGWDLVLASARGTRSMRAVVERPLDVAGPHTLTGSDTWIHCDVPRPARLPPATRLPATLPAVAALAEAAPLFTGEPGLGWGFAYACATRSCDEVEARVWFGTFVAQADVRTPGGLLRPDPVGGWRGAIEQVGADDEGRLVHRRHGSFQKTTLVEEAVVAPFALDERAAPAWPGTPSLALPIAAVAATALGLAWAVRVALAWALHTRLATDRLFEHPVRARIQQLLAAHPGMHVRRLRREAQLQPGALDHHLRVLERAGLVRAERDRGFTCLFLTGASADLVAAGASVRTETARWILAEVHAHPAITARVLAERRGVHPSSILHHMRRLVGRGLVVRQRATDGLRLTLTPRGEDVAAALGLTAADRDPA